MTMIKDKINIHPEWAKVLEPIWDEENMKSIKDGILTSRNAGIEVFPPGKMIFNAFNRTPFSKIKVVILGQDPYHRPGQAMGLSFSVPKDVRIPASLRNIYKELIRDVHIQTPAHGDLSSWADQGVLLLNAILTVESGNAASHRKLGWQKFTDDIIQLISDKREGVVFMLWGNFARSKKSLIDASRHFILEAVHPSPLAGNKFSGCAHFSQANKLIQQQGQEPIDWSVPDA